MGSGCQFTFFSSRSGAEGAAWHVGYRGRTVQGLWGASFCLWHPNKTEGTEMSQLLKVEEARTLLATHPLLAHAGECLAVLCTPLHAGALEQ